MGMRFLLAAVVLILVAYVPVTGAKPEVDGAVFIDDTGTYDADFGWIGPCNGAVTIVVTIHRPGGDDVRSVDAASKMVPDACFTPTCLDCPPVPIPFAWEMKGNGALLAGGGTSYYYTYQNWEAAWTLEGTFQEGKLEARGSLL